MAPPVVLTGRRADVLKPLAAEFGGRAIVADLSERDATGRLMDDAGAVDICLESAECRAHARCMLSWHKGVGPRTPLARDP